MASFSLWEHLLSFISVSWMYRTTLVSAGRENADQEPPSMGYGVVFKDGGQELGLKLGDRLHSFSQGPFCLGGNQMPAFSSWLLPSKWNQSTVVT